MCVVCFVIYIEFEYGYFRTTEIFDKFFKIFVVGVLSTGPVTLNLVMKIACFAQIGPFLNFFSFPSNFCNYSLSSSFHPFPKHTMHSTINSFVDHLSNLILQEKGTGFCFLTLFCMYMSVFLHFVWFC